LNKPICAVLLPTGTRRDCFEDKDWQTLEERCAVRFPATDEIRGEAPTLMERAEVVLTGWGSCPLTAEVLAPAPHLRLWMHSAGSMAGFVSDALWERDLVYSTCNDVLARGVAEYALTLTILSLKGIIPLHERLKASQTWKDARNSIPVRELCNLTVGIAGFGRVARHLARLLESFTGLKLLVYDPFASDELLHGHGAERTDLMTLFRESTVVHNCVPATAATAGMIQKEHFGAMQDGAILINTGRGATMDESALIEELDKGRIFCCLDVTHPEPPAEGSPLFRLPNCLMTPHIAGAVSNGRKLQGEFAVQEIVRFLEGKPLQGALRKEDILTMTGGPGWQEK